MRMHNPPHPGKIIKALCLEPLGVTVTQAAEALGVSRKTLSAILNGRAGISPEMAVRLSIAFGTSAESEARVGIEDAQSLDCLQGRDRAGGRRSVAGRSGRAAWRPRVRRDAGDGRLKGSGSGPSGHS